MFVAHYRRTMAGAKQTYVDTPIDLKKKKGHLQDLTH